MKLVGALAFCLVATLGPVPMRAQAVTSDTLQKFFKDRRAQFTRNESKDWEDILYLSANANLSPDTVIEEFARRIGVSPAAARDYAGVIIDSVVEDETCQVAWPPARCAFLPGRPRYDRAASAGLADPTGALLAVVGRSWLFTRQDHAAFIALAGAHPAAATIFATLFERRPQPEHLLAMLASGLLTDTAVVTVATAGRSDLHWSRADDAWRQAMFESVEGSFAHGTSVVARAALAQMALRWELDLGLTDAAVASYYAYPADVRRLLPLPLGVCVALAKDCSEAASGGYRLADDLAAALWLTGHTQDARRLLQRRIADFGPRRVDIDQRYQALSDAISPAHSREDLFPLFTEGGLPRQPMPRASDDRLQQTIGLVDIADVPLFPGAGWVFRVRDSSDALRRVVARRLRRAGYDDMAAYLEAPAQRLRGLGRDPVVVALESMFPGSIRTRQAYWETRIARAETGGTKSGGTLQVSTRDLPAWWVERSLPESLPPWRETDTPQKPPPGVGLPVEPRAILRYEERGGERAIVYQSSDHELPTAMASPLGLWFVQTAGGKWTSPIYLGLQQGFPYTVTAGSRLALLDGNRLRVEVRAFPRVVRDQIQAADAPYLEFDLAALTSDRDKDGLTDIVEQRLGLDFTNADTDGDGVPDSRDPLPLTRFRAVRSALNRELTLAIVSALFRPEAGATVVTSGPPPRLDGPVGTRTRFLVGEPALFAGVSTPFRLVVYSPRDFAAVNRNTEFAVPTRIEHFSSVDGTTHYVLVSGSGGGKIFIATCGRSGGSCSVRNIGGWMT